MLEKIRSVLRPELRERAYVLVGAIVTGLTSMSLVDAGTATAWGSLVVSALTLAIALLHSTSTWRSALYSFMLAMQAVAGVYGILTENAWGLIIQITAALLGLGTAAAKTPTPLIGETHTVPRRPIQ